MGHAINRPVRRLDVVEKVTGQAMYGADLKFERMLYGKGLYAEHPHARIVSIDASEAEAMEGVACVVTARDIPGMKVMGEVMQDQYILADDKTRFFGDVVACVAAETPELAAEAVRRIRVEYEALPAFLTRAGRKITSRSSRRTIPATSFRSAGSARATRKRRWPPAMSLSIRIIPRSSSSMPISSRRRWSPCRRTRARC